MNHEVESLRRRLGELNEANKKISENETRIALLSQELERVNVIGERRNS